MDTFELLNSYFPLVLGCIEPEEVNSLRDILKEYIKDNLGNIKAMAKKDSLFTYFFPSEDDPAFKHWPKLEKELAKGKPVEVMEFFLKLEENEFCKKHDDLKKKYFNAEVLPKIDGLTDLFIRKIKNKHNSIIYDSKEMKFKTNFSSILELSDPISTYDAFRCFVPQKYVKGYIYNPINQNEYDNIKINAWLKGFKKNYNYYIPIKKTFRRYELASYKEMRLKWEYEKKRILSIFAEINRDEEFKNTWELGLNNGVEYIENKIKEQDIESLFEERGLDFTPLGLHS
jgi:hypothetical protein